MPKSTWKVKWICLFASQHIQIKTKRVFLQMTHVKVSSIQKNDFEFINNKFKDKSFYSNILFFGANVRFGVVVCPFYSNLSEWIVCASKCPLLIALTNINKSEEFPLVFYLIDFIHKTLLHLMRYYADSLSVQFLQVHQTAFI